MRLARIPLALVVVIPKQWPEEKSCMMEISIRAAELMDDLGFD
jgi:hypothetical protein